MSCSGEVKVIGERVENILKVDRKVRVEPKGYADYGIYEVQVLYRGSLNSERVMYIADQLERRVQNLKVLYAGFTNDTLTLQVTGGFAWESFLSALPSILIALAVLIVAIIVLLVILKLPGEYLALIIIALGVPISILIAYSIYREMKREERGR